MILSAAALIFTIPEGSFIKISASDALPVVVKYALNELIVNVVVFFELDKYKINKVQKTLCTLLYRVVVQHSIIKDEHAIVSIYDLYLHYGQH